MTTSWTDPTTGVEVRVGDRWRDMEPIYKRTRYPLRTLDVAGFMFGVKPKVTVQARTRTFTYKEREIKGHLVNIDLASFVRRFELVSRAPDADPNALKPCPFCGSTDLYFDELTSVGCHGCGAASGTPDQDATVDEREAEARRLWNQRAGGVS